MPESFQVATAFTGPFVDLAAGGVIVNFLAVPLGLIRAAEHGGGSFGAALVKEGEIVSTEDQIYTASAFTFHAEAGLLRRFCAETKITDLSEYTLYSSCEPCFIC